VYPVLCVSLVVHSERLDDGRYHLMIRGLCRAQMQRDLRDGAYRRALLEGLLDNDGQTPSAEAQRLRQTVREAIRGPAFDELPEIRRYRRMVDSDLPLGHVTDLLAFHLLPSNTMQVKRLMLEQLDVVERARLVLSELQTLEKALERIAARRENWPPRECAN
jgi:Lon protease-like protein